MTNSPERTNAILAMDSDNRGYNTGLAGLGENCICETTRRLESAT